SGREAPERAAPADEPFWAGWEGSLVVLFDSIRFPAGYALDAPELRVLVHDSIDAGARATLLGGPVTVNTELGFDAGLDRPYLLSGSARVDGADLTAMFRAAQPDRPPTIEGIFSFDSNLMSDGAPLGDLIARLRGDALLSS